MDLREFTDPVSPHAVNTKAHDRFWSQSKVDRSAAIQRTNEWIRQCMAGTASDTLDNAYSSNKHAPSTR